VVFGAPYYRRFARNIHVKAFVQGVTAAAVGAIAGAAFILGKRALIDAPTVGIAGATFGLLSLKKIPEPVLIFGAGIAGLLLFKR
jgi:chromate transporter